MRAPELLLVDRADSTSTAQSSWSRWNQRSLVAQIADLRARIAARGQRTRDADENRCDFTLSDARVGETAGELVPALARVNSLFGLSEFECDVLLLVAGLELDSSLRSTLSEVTGGATRATFAHAFELLDAAHWDAMSPQRPLRYWRLIALDPAASIVQSPLRIDERILHEITGVAAVDERLHGLVRHAHASEEGACANTECAKRIVRAIAGKRRTLLVAASADADDSVAGCEPAAIATLAHAAVNTLSMDANDLPADPRELGEVARALDREAALTDSVVLIRLHGHCEHARDYDQRVASLLDRLCSHVMLLGTLSGALLSSVQQQRSIVKLTFDTPHHNVVDTGNPALARAVRSARQQFPVTRGQLDSALACMDLPAPTEPDADTRTHAIVWRALREAARGGLESLAQRIESGTTFADLVLPAVQLATLREMTSQLRNRERVYRDWGFGAASSRGLGLAALFAGESGTGKTMAAEAIANDAQLDLFRIDLASVVNKYIGETEKNLKRLFDAAQTSGAVLLFDEADALFGKRSEVKDSHDRYANIEVAYLLQRIEAYRGLAILTTNMKGALDPAFMRRIRFVVQFPFPDAAAREQIWRRQLQCGAPLSNIDFATLGRLQVAGGNIRAIAVNAAFRAADLDQPISQDLLLHAAHAEFAKLGRSFAALGEGNLR